MRLLWLTDLHLNFCSRPIVNQLLADIAAAAPDALVVTGDIAEARDVVSWLERLDDHLQRPLFFVLGNHDYYFGSIAQVRQTMADLCAARPRLQYLSQREVIPLTPAVGLVGHDGWADARLGDYARSRVMLNDYRLIQELAHFAHPARRAALEALGDEAAAHVRRVLPLACAAYREVVLATHVPPFHGACWHEGRLSDDEWVPHFACRAMGEAIIEVAAAYPDCRITVLCGHTHGAGEYQPLPNTLVVTGGAEYRQPAIQRVLTWP